MTTFDLNQRWTSRRGLLIASAGAVFSRLGKAATPACTLTSEQEEGPYYVDDEKLRVDISEGRPGIPVRLRVAVVDSRSCAPLPNTAIDIWHCDAAGVYSGFTSVSPDGPGAGGGRFGPRGGPPPGDFGPGGTRPNGPPRGGPGGRPKVVDATRFLRGVQLSDSAGMVEFATVYPGWYSGRAIHIHVKAHIGSLTGRVAHTGQFFFPEDLTEKVAQMAPYARRLSVHRTTQSEDHVFQGQHGSEQMLSTSRLGKSNSDGFLASITVAINPEASPGPAGRGRGPRA